MRISTLAGRMVLRASLGLAALGALVAFVASPASASAATVGHQGRGPQTITLAFTGTGTSYQSTIGRHPRVGEYVNITEALHPGYHPHGYVIGFDSIHGVIVARAWHDGHPDALIRYSARYQFRNGASFVAFVTTWVDQTNFVAALFGTNYLEGVNGQLCVSIGNSNVTRYLATLYVPGWDSSARSAAAGVRNMAMSG